MSVKVDLSRALSRAYEKANVETLNKAAVLLAVAKNAEAVKFQVRAAPVVGRRPPATASVPSDLAGVALCIKQHESGNYTEHSHPSDGSGAYQFIRSTWVAWSARAGRAGYAYAYLAPPEVQDAVLVYALTHGGAGNWSNRWGNDPCTAGLPGGG